MSSYAATKIEHKSGAAHHIQLLQGALPFLLGLELLAWLIILPIGMRGHADFRQLYAAGYMVRTGHAHELYDYNSELQFQNQLVGPAQMPLPFIRPAYCTLLFAAISVLPYRIAYLAFMGVNCILLAFSYWLMKAWLRNLVRLWSLLPAMLFLAFYPVSAALLQGQDSILLLAVLVGTLVLLSRGRELMGGLLLGLGLFKFQIVIPVAILFVLWRRWRFSMGFLITGSAALALSAAIVGLNESRHYVQWLTSTRDSGSFTSNDHTYPILTGFMPNIHGFIVGIFGGHLSQDWVKAITISVSLAIIMAAGTITHRRLSAIDAFIVAVPAAVVASYYLFLHDLTVLLIPVALTLDNLAQLDYSSKPTDRWLAWITVFVFVFPTCDLFAVRLRYLFSIPLLIFLIFLVRHSLLVSTRSANLQEASSYNRPEPQQSLGVL
jgi:hypothetical protein